MQLRKADVKRVIDTQTYQRGKSYAEQGKIFAPKIDGSKLEAKCVGSYESHYRLFCHVQNNKIGSARCSCPLGSGGRCKHIAALLLTWIDHPDQFRPVINLENAIDNLPVDQLRAILSHLINLNQNNRELVQTFVDSLQDETITSILEVRERMKALIPISMYYEDDEIEERISSITSSAQLLINSGKYIHAATHLVVMIDHITDLYPDQIYDEEGDIIYEINRATSKLKEVLSHIKQGDNRSTVLITLFQILEKDYKIGGYGFSDGIVDILLEEVTDEEQHLIADLVEERLSSHDTDLSDWAERELRKFLLQLREPTEITEEYLNLIKETDRKLYISKIIELQKDEEVKTEVSQLNTSEFSRYIDELEDNGYTGLIEDEIVFRSKQSINYNLLEWLFSYYQVENRKNDAILIGIDLMKEKPSFDIYITIKKMARELGKWNRTEETILSEFSNDSYTPLIVKIHLEEGRHGEAVKGMVEILSEDLGFWYYDLAERVINVASAEFPKKCIEIYQNIIQDYIDRKQREHYQQACEYMLDLKDLMIKNNLEDKWLAYLKEIYDTYHRYRALKDELQKVGLQNPE